MANVIKHKRGSGSDPVANDLVVGELAIRTDTGKLFTKMDSGALAEIAGGGSDIAINTLSSSSGTGGGSATFNGSAFRFTLSAPPSVSAQQLLVSINGVIQKPVAGTGQPSEGFSVDGSDIILGDAPEAGSDFFILTFRSLGVSVPADNSVTSAKIADGAIVNADINASAAIAGTKIDPDFGNQTIRTTGELRIENASPAIRLVDTGQNPDYFIQNNNGGLRIQDLTNSVDRFTIHSDGHVDINGNLDALSGLDVTGAITGTGDLTIDTNTLHVDSSNNRVGIGTTSPDAKLEIAGSQVRIRSTDTGSDAILDFYGQSTNNGAIIRSFGSDGSAGHFHFRNANNPAMTINSSGQVGIGTTSPQSLLSVKVSTARQLDVIKDSGDDHLVLQSTSPDASFNMRSIELAGSDVSFSTGASSGTSYTQRMVIESSGNIVANFDGSSATGQLQIADGSASSPGLSFWADGSADTGIFRHSANILNISTAGIERFRLSAEGNASIGGIQPVPTDSAYNKALLHIHQTQSGTFGSQIHLTNNTTGSTATDGMFLASWIDSNVYLTNQEAGVINFTTNGAIGAIVTSDGLKLPAGKGINFSAYATSGNPSSNLLYDYEEGTFTPAYKTGSASSDMFDSAVYRVTEGHYTKIGRLVSFSIRIECLSITNPNSGADVKITGLPFTQASGNLEGGAFFSASGAFDTSNSGRVPTMVVPFASSTLVFLNTNGTNLTVGSSNNNFLGIAHIRGSYFA